MRESRLSIPPKSKSTPVLLILLLLGLAVAAGGLTWVFYPSEPPPAPAVRPRSHAPPLQKLVEIPVSEPVTPDEPSEDAGVDGDADDGAAKRPQKRRPVKQGTIDRRRLSAFIRSKQGQVRQCYERRLRQNHMLQGTLVAQIKIAPSGRASSVSFPQDTLRDGQVRECVSRAIKGWRFPEPEGGFVTVSNPFRFAPRND